MESDIKLDILPVVHENEDKIVVSQEKTNLISQHVESFEEMDVRACGIF